MKEKLIEKTFFTIATLLILIIILIVIFIISQAMPAFNNYGFLNFIFGFNWNPNSQLYGLFPMIIATLAIAISALIIATPLAIGCGVFIEQYLSNNIKKLFKPVIQTLAGIPSVVYGFFGLVVIVPFIQNNFTGNGFSLIAASIVLAIMILPTIIVLTQDAIKSVPIELKQASLALGLTDFQTLKNITLPYASKGIITAMILGLGRAVGETLAVLMIAGNVSQIPSSIFDPVRTLTSNIALEMGYATDIHYNALFATAVILFILILILILISNYIQGDINES